MDQVVYHSDLDVLILLYQIDTQTRNLLENKEVLFTISSRFNLKNIAVSFRNLIRGYNKKYMTSYCFQQSIPECYIYAARCGDLILIQKCTPLIQDMKEYSFYRVKACIKAIKYKLYSMCELLVPLNLDAEWGITLKFFKTAAYYGNIDVINKIAKTTKQVTMFTGFNEKVDQLRYEGCLSAAQAGRIQVFETIHEISKFTPATKDLIDFALAAMKNGHVEMFHHIIYECCTARYPPILIELEVFAKLKLEDECLNIVTRTHNGFAKFHYIDDEFSHVKATTMMSSNGFINIVTILIERMISMKYKTSLSQIIEWIDNLKNRKPTAKWIESKIAELLE